MKKKIRKASGGRSGERKKGTPVEMIKYTRTSLPHKRGGRMGGGWVGEGKVKVGRRGVCIMKGKEQAAHSIADLGQRTTLRDCLRERETQSYGRQERNAGMGIKS